MVMMVMMIIYALVTLYNNVTKQFIHNVNGDRSKTAKIMTYDGDIAHYHIALLSV